MSFVISEDKVVLEEWQATIDNVTGYPEPLDSFVNIGSPPYVPTELGRAYHFADIMTDQSGTRFALPYSDATVIPDGVTVVDELPTDWWADGLFSQE